MSGLCVQGLTTRHVGPVDLTVGAGECVCIEGASGSGKTLLLRAIADLDPHAGHAWVDGLACDDLPAPQWRRKVCLLTAESQWWEERIGGHFDDGVAPEWLESLDLPPDSLEWEVARCSTGERQRLALLRVLAAGPQVLLLDEPTGNLDARSTGRVEALLDDYRRKHGAALLWVSHDPEQIARVAHRSFVLANGRLQARDPA